MPGRPSQPRKSRKSAPSQGSHASAAPITPLPIPVQALSKIRTIVVYGGSFDPPHYYHTLGPLAAVQRICGKSGWLLYVPAARSPHKPDGPIAPDAHRLAMLNLALDLPGPRSIWTDELDRARWHADRREPTSSYTIETLVRLQRILPASVRLRLLIGSDQVSAFHRWKEPRQIIELAEPIVMPREPAVLVSSLYSALDQDFWTQQEKAAWCTRMAPTFPMPAASTHLRAAIPGAPARAAAWERRTALQGIITPVAQYIIDHNLYGFRPGPAVAATAVAAPSGDAPGAMQTILANVERTLDSMLDQGLANAGSALRKPARAKTTKKKPARSAAKKATRQRRSH